MKYHRIKALMLKYWYMSINDLDRLFDVFYWPTLDLIIWGFASLFIMQLSNVNVLSVILGAVILWLFVMRSSQDLGIFILEDFWQRNIYNLFASPLKNQELVTSVVVFALLRSLITFAFVSLVAFLLYSFNIFSIGIITFGLFAFLLVMFGWVIGMFVSGIIFRFGSRIQVIAWSLGFIIQPFSCVFYPLSALPVWAQKIAIVLPTTHIFEAMRAVINEQPVPIGGLLYASSVIVVLLFLSGYYFYRSIEKAKKTGLLTRYQ